VIEIAKEFVKPVHGGQELIAVAEMVLAELAGGVAERLEQVRVSMRFEVRWPVSSIFCLPTRPNLGSSVGSSTSVAKV
jgi:hypothetical protein